MPAMPVVPEAEWMPQLLQLPVAPREACARVLVVAPHPDDETLAAGGLIATMCAAGVQVQVLAVTDGEAAYGPADPALAALRIAEQTEALGVLGVPPEHITRLHLPDSHVGLNEDAVAEAIAAAADAGTHILAPWTGDFHPDHEACGRAATHAARQTGAALSGWLFWFWHHGKPAQLPAGAVRAPVGEAALRLKARALLCHESQLTHAADHPILPATLLHPARWPFEVFVPLSNLRMPATHDRSDSDAA